MPYTKEQLEFMRNLPEDQQRRVLSKLSDDEKTDLVESFKSYDAGSAPKQEQPKKTLGQKVRDLPIDPALSRVGSALGIDALQPTIGNVLQGGKRAWESIAQGHLKMPTILQAATPVGGALLAAKALIPDYEQKRASGYNKLTDYIKSDETKYAQEQKPNMLGETIGGMLAVPIPGAGGVGGVARRVGTAALQGGLESAAFSTTVADDYWRDKVGKFATGAAFAGGLNAGATWLGAGGKWVSQKSKELMAGTKVGRLLGIKTEVNPAYKGAMDLAEQFEREGVRPDTAAVTGNPVLIAQSKELHRNDPKYMSWLVEQAKESGRALDRVVGELKDAVKAEKWDGIEQIRAIAADPTAKRYKSANRLLESIENSGDDWKQIVQSGGGLNLYLAKLRSDANFDKLSVMDNAIRQGKLAKAESIADQANAAARQTHKLDLEDAAQRHEYILGQKQKAWEHDIKNAMLDADDAKASYDATAPFAIGPEKQRIEARYQKALSDKDAMIEQINKDRSAEIEGLKKAHTKSYAELESSFKPVKPSMSQVADIPATQFISTVKSAASEVDDPELGKIMGKLKDGSIDFSFSGLRKLRSEVNAHIDALRGDLAAPSKTAIPQLERVQKALETHLDDYAESMGPAFKAQYRKAMDEFKRDVVPFKQANFNKALAAEDPLKAARVFEGSNIYDKRKMWELLPEKSRSAVLSGLVEEALVKGEVKKIGDVGMEFSPAKAATVLEDLIDSDTLSVVTKSNPGMVQRIKGLARILRSVSASNAGFMPQTGAVTQSFTKPKDATMGKALSYGVNWFNKRNIKAMLMDPKNKGLLVLASKMNPESRAFRNMMDKMMPSVIARTQVEPLVEPVDNEQTQETE
jgi:hypothetical protein